MAECFFCGRDEKLTRAHLFQERFRQAIPSDDQAEVKIASSSHQTLGVERDVRFMGDIRQTNVTSLCGACNSNWMGTIEIAAGPVFERIMQGDGLPPRGDLFKLAHWATVVSALASEMHPRLTIPVAGRRAIRFTKTGQPEDYSTFFIWTKDVYPGIATSIFRVASPDEEGSVSWYHFLHAGPFVALSASPPLSGRIARVLKEHHISTVLGAISSNLLYVPDDFALAINTEQDFPSHDDVRALAPKVLGGDPQYMETAKGSEVLDLSGGLSIREVDLSFDFTGTLTDVRNDLDLSYLSRVFAPTPD